MIYPIFLVNMGLLDHDWSRCYPRFSGEDRWKIGRIWSHFSGYVMGKYPWKRGQKCLDCVRSSPAKTCDFFRIYGWFAAPFFDNSHFFRIFFYISKHHRWIFPWIFPKIQVTWIDLHPQHLLHRLLIEAALKDAPPLWPLRAAWENLQRPPGWKIPRHR